MIAIRLIFFVAIAFAMITASVFTNRTFFSLNLAEEERNKRRAIAMLILFLISMGMAIAIDLYW